MHLDTSPRTSDRRRRSERVLLRIPIEVKGARVDGKSFKETTHTLVINRHGARIALRTPLFPESQVTITNLQTKASCPFRVIGRTATPLGEGPEWGVECLDPDIDFWGIYFPEKAETPSGQELIDVLLECSGCHFREVAKLTLDEYRTIVTASSVPRDCVTCVTATEWRFAFAESEPEAAYEPVPVYAPLSPVRTEPVERRRAKRVTVKLPVRIRLQDGREEVARTENLSKTGVCFSCDLTVNVQDRVLLTVGYVPGENEIEIPARIVWRRHEGTCALYGAHLEDST